MKKFAIQSILLSMSCICFGQTNTLTSLQKMTEIYNGYNIEMVNKNDLQSRNEFLRDSTLIFEDDPTNLVNKKTYAYNDQCEWIFEATLNPDQTSITGYSFETSLWRLLNNDGLTHSILQYQGNAFNNGIPLEKIEYTYNEDGLVVEYVTSVFENGDWENYRRRTYDFDSTLFGQGYTDFYWDEVAEAWSIYEFGAFILSAQNVPLITQAFVQNPDYTFIDNHQQYDYVFTGNSDLIESITMSLFDDATNSWNELFRSSYTYENGNETSFLFEVYNVDELSWNDYSRIDKTYIDDTYVEFEDTYLNQDDIWTFSARNHHFYSDSDCVVSNEVIVNKNVEMNFANPMTENMALDISGISEPVHLYLHAFDGRTILSSPIDSDQTIYLPRNLPKGMYAVNLLENNNVIMTKKVVMQ